MTTLNIKFLRVQSGMTLEQLATDSGLTRSYLSKLERGLSQPSIGSAVKIAEALGTTLDRLYGQSNDKDPITVVRALNGKAGDNDSYLSLVAGLSPDRAMRAFIVRPTRTAKHGRIMSHHEGEEILFVLTGKIELLIGKRIEILSPGDCLQFDSTIPHRLTQASSEPASALVVIANTSI
jgi:transcriptional regulator with XRE-family HTH domain